MWTRKELKERGKAAFKANYWNSVIAALILTIFIGAGASGTSTSINNAKSKVTQNQQSSLVQSGDDSLLSINGVEIDLNTIDGESLEKALDAYSEGLKNGKLNINGEDIDITDPEDLKKAQKTMEAIENLKQSGVGSLSHDEIVGGLGLILMILGGMMITVMIVSSLVKIFVFNPIEVGCRAFFNENSSYKAGLGEIKRGFTPSYGRNVGTMFLKDLFICLWSLLFVIPGIVKTYSYSMVPFILADNPDMGAKEAITLSRKMMNGNKWKAFVLDLSFIGWHILSALTCGLVGIFYVYPYVYSTDAELYNVLKAQV